MPRELAIPPTAQRDPKSVEVARIWHADGREHVTLATGMWDDPGAWGLLMVDIAKHVANAYQQSRGRNRTETLNRIKQAFEAEWEFPTDTPMGTIMDD